MLVVRSPKVAMVGQASVFEWTAARLGTLALTRKVLILFVVV